MSEEEKPLRKVHMVVRRLDMRTGDRVVLPMALYDDEATCKAAAEVAQRQLNELVNMCMIVKQYRTPEGEVHAQPVMRLSELLADFGIGGIAHAIVAHDVTSSAGIVLAKPNIILAGTKH